jgi:hypothetical protein
MEVAENGKRYKREKMVLPRPSKNGNLNWLAANNMP